jgi:lipopolysaccharide export system protein LptA
MRLRPSHSIPSGDLSADNKCWIFKSDNGLNDHIPRKRNPKGVRRLAPPLLAIMLAVPAFSTADAGPGMAEAFESGRFGRGGEPVYFSGDRFSYNLKGRIMRGSGRIEIVQGDATLTGGKIVIDLAASVAEIEGDVEVRRLNDTLTGQKGVYDFEKGEGVFSDARGSSEPWYVSADEIEREASGRYTVDRSAITTCDLPEPHYRLAAKTTTVIPEERVVARGIRLYAGSVPVFYLPYYSHRLGTGRPPIELEAGTQTDLGAYARVGYNLELGEKVLLNPHVWGFAESGVGGGLNGRLSLFEDKGIGRFDSFYISDQNDDNTDDVGVEQDRGKVDFYYRQELPYDVTALVQAEYITDREFLKTFDFDDYTERELPESFVNVERTGAHDVVSLTIRERLVDYIEDVDRLPELRVELLDQRIFDTGFFYGVTSAVANLDNEVTGFDTKRGFALGRLSRPTRLWNWLGLVPFAEGNGAYYSDTLIEEDEGRFSWSSGIVAQSRFDKVYGSPFGQYSAFRHLIVPTATYRFRPTPDNEPEELPGFDSIDFIDRENTLEIEIKNYLQAKDAEGEIVDIVEYNFTAGLEFDDGEDKLASLENELLLRPVPNWELALKTVSDFRDATRSDLVSAVVRYAEPDSLRASLGLVHEDTIEKPFDTQVIYSLGKAFGPLWRAGFGQHYSISESDITYQEFWVWRDLHCWEAMLRVRDRREATTVMALFNIKAFPMRRIDRRTALNPIGEDHPWPTRW